MRDGETTSWRRQSDGKRGTAAMRSHENEARRVEAWEDEGGKTAVADNAVRILIVDNDMGSADSIEKMLHALGYSETRVAYSGHAALAIAEDFHPDVVLLELDLLDMGGYELAQSLRQHAQAEDMRLIALTSSREHAGRDLARLAGFERYLLKPIGATGLSDLLTPPSQQAQTVGRPSA